MSQEALQNNHIKPGDWVKAAGQRYEPAKPLNEKEWLLVGGKSSHLIKKKGVTTARSIGCVLSVRGDLVVMQCGGRTEIAELTNCIPCPMPKNRQPDPMDAQMTIEDVLDNAEDIVPLDKA